MTTTERFASNVRALRKARGLSQEELSFRASLHRTQISLLERGDRLPRFETLIRLAGALDATPNDLAAGIRWDPIIAVSGGLLISEEEA